jgi:acyl carrier protein
LGVTFQGGQPVVIDDRLVRCFSSVFPELTEEQILAADVELLSSVDSLAGVTLVALIDEEFGFDLDFEDLLRLGTFEAIQQYVIDHSLSSRLSP